MIFSVTLVSIFRLTVCIYNFRFLMLLKMDVFSAYQ